MKRLKIIGIAIVLVVVAVLVFHYDILNLRRDKADAIATIIENEDTRRVTDRLMTYLTDPDPEIRARAALAIGRIGDIAASEKLLKLFYDSSDAVVSSAAFGLGLTGEKRFASLLLEFCPDLKPELLADAIEAVGRLTDSSMTDIITALAGYLDNPDHRVREQAAYALWRAGGKAEKARLIDIASHDPVKTVRTAALYALVRLGIPDPIDLYAEMIADSDPFVRTCAIRGVALAKNDSKTYLAAVGLNDRDNNVVTQAITSLAAMGSPKATGYLADRYLSETDEKLIVQLLESLTRLKSDLIAERANAAIDSCTDSNIRAATLVYLARVWQGDAIPLIDSLLPDADRRLKVGVCEALGSIGGEYVKPRLSALFKDGIAEVRASAFDALCTTDAVNIDYYIKAALDDTDYMVVAQAVDKIGRLKNRSYLGRLMGIMKDRQQNDTDLRRTIVAAASEFLGGDEIDSLAEDILYHGLQDKEYLVSRDAAEIYKTKLGQDKTAYVNKPSGLWSRQEIRRFLSGHKVNPRAIISTNRGDFEMELYVDSAPMAVYNFMKLAKDGFYNNLTFHRVIPGFVVQGGDPHGDGFGGPGYCIRCEYNNRRFERGTVGMATSGKDSGGSQFFVMPARQPHLDARYTLFGKVTAGMETIDKIVRGDTIKAVRLVEEKSK